MNKETARQEVAKLVEKFESYPKDEINSMPEEQIFGFPFAKLSFNLIKCSFNSTGNLEGF